MASTVQVGAKSMNFPAPPTFTDPLLERKHKLERLAGAFRIFGKMGYDEGIAGHLSASRGLAWVGPCRGWR